MPLTPLTFPDPSLADENGLLAIGGDLSPERLILAYRSGIFPWFSGNIPMWYCPDPRFVLFPTEIKVSQSMRQLLRKQVFQVTVNHCFSDVIEACCRIHRPGQDGTWITPAMMQAYKNLHNLGYAVSVEAWKDGQLSGGLYGIRLGPFFFGESMFSRQNNASKYAFISYVKRLEHEGVLLIDCQVHTPHLESLGARYMPKAWFLHQLRVLKTES